MSKRSIWILAACLFIVAALVAAQCVATPSKSKDRRASDKTQATASAFAVVTTPLPPVGVKPVQDERDAAFSRVRVAAPWGTSAGDLGRLRPQEGNPEAPMSFAFTPDGKMVALDQVNRRLSFFNKNGQHERDIKTEQRVPQDVAVAKNGNLAVLDRLGDKDVTIVDKDGRAVGKLPLEGPGIPKTGGVTGVFVDGKDVYAEYEHGKLVLLGGVDGTVAKDRSELPGRPSRDGRLIIAAGIVQAVEGRMWVSATDRATMTHRFTRELRMAMPILRIVLLDSDLAGTIYTAAHLGDETLDTASGVQLVCLDPDKGNPIGRAFIPVPDDPDEMFKTMTVLDEGGVVIAVPSDHGIEYRTYGCND
ncbi:MAG: hypothetical protein HY898_25850 [Deltaproteobacteria bacterium]|nr:hypothetical protein [Deltaproteobacteria bacterium]